MKRCWKLLSGLVVLAALCSLPAWGQKKEDPKKGPLPIPDSVELVKDVEFGKGGGRALTLHIIKPKKTPAAPMPVLVWIHGGGWQAGNKDSGIARSIPLAAQGYFCVSVEYRLSSEAVFPAQIEDCKCAIRFLRAKAKDYHLDPNRIGVWGSSAGGHLVALLGTSGSLKELEGKGGWQDQSSQVQAVVDFCGPTDFTRIKIDSAAANNAVAKLLGGPIGEKKALAALASPITHVHKNCPPMLLVHGDEDKTVPLEQSRFFFDALKKVGAPVELYVAQGRGHGITGEDVVQVVQQFWDRTLKGKN